MLDYYNAALALVAFIALLCVAHRMTRDTNHAFRGALLLLAVALFGEGIGVYFGLWAAWLDTLLYCGILALFLADVRRQELAGAWARRASVVVQAFAWVFFFVAPSFVGALE